MFNLRRLVLKVRQRYLSARNLEAQVLQAMVDLLLQVQLDNSKVSRWLDDAKPFLCSLEIIFSFLLRWFCKLKLKSKKQLIIYYLTFIYRWAAIIGRSKQRWSRSVKLQNEAAFASNASAKVDILKDLSYMHKQSLIKNKPWFVLVAVSAQSCASMNINDLFK